MRFIPFSTVYGILQGGWNKTCVFMGLTSLSGGVSQAVLDTEMKNTVAGMTRAIKRRNGANGRWHLTL